MVKAHNTASVMICMGKPYMEQDQKYASGVRSDLSAWVDRIDK